MQLLEEIAAGIEDAASGWVEVKSRGTSQDVAVYSDPEGLTQRTGTQHVLGSSGQLECYVSQQVDIYVYDSGGVLLRGPFTHISRAAVLVDSNQSFTGTDPVSGATGVNKEVKQSTINAAWKDSAGGINWKVQSDVASTPAQANLKSIGVTVMTAFYNPKDPVYGAKGDGTTDDTTALQNCINAIETAGGGVMLLTPGTYNVSNELVIDALAGTGVIVFGIGNPIIQTTVTNKNIFTITAAGTSLENLRLEVATAAGADSTGYGVALTSADGSMIRNVSVSSVSATYAFARGVSITTASRVTVTDCLEVRGNAAGIFVTATAQADGNIKIVNSSFYADAVAGKAVDVDDLAVVSVSNVTAVSSDVTAADFDITDCTKVSIEGLVCHGSAIVTCDANTANLKETASFYGTLTCTVGANNATNRWGSATYKGVDIVSATTIVLPNHGQHGCHDITGTTAITTITVTGIEEGTEVTLQFDDALTLTDNTGNIDLNGGANLTTAVGDAVQLKLINARWKEVGRCDT